jgi:pseudaminic acid cytidylyltransferase
MENATLVATLNSGVKLYSSIMGSPACSPPESTTPESTTQAITSLSIEKPIAIILARGGSKRIPGKNIRPFLGKPIMAYSIEAARSSNLFEMVVVSTDSGEIEDVALKYGATVHRHSIMGDNSTMAESITEVLNTFSKDMQFFDKACMIYACAPFVTADRLAEGFQQLLKGYHVVCPVYRGPHVERAMRIDGGHIHSRFSEFDNKNSHEWPDSYYHAGQWFWFDVAQFLISESFMADKIWGVVIGRDEAVDIDTDEDWRWAERLYATKHPVFAHDALIDSIKSKRRVGMIDGWLRTKGGDVWRPNSENGNK